MDAAVLNLPNMLTLIRILTIPIFLEFLAYHLYWQGCWCFAIGGFTDFFDGFVARWINQQTALGAYLDPVADKLLVISSFIMLGLIDGIPMWLTVVVVVRDVLIVVGYGAIYILVEEKLRSGQASSASGARPCRLFTLAVALVMLARPKFAPSPMF